MQGILTVELLLQKKNAIHFHYKDQQFDAVLGSNCCVFWE